MSATWQPGRLYSLLVCPMCRRQLRLEECDGGMYARVQCCGVYWMSPDDVGDTHESAARHIWAVEVQE